MKEILTKARFWLPFVSGSMCWRTVPGHVRGWRKLGRGGPVPVIPPLLTGAERTRCCADGGPRGRTSVGAARRSLPPAETVFRAGGPSSGTAAQELPPGRSPTPDGRTCLPKPSAASYSQLVLTTSSTRPTRFLESTKMQGPAVALKGANSRVKHIGRRRGSKAKGQIFAGLTGQEDGLGAAGAAGGTRAGPQNSTRLRKQGQRL